MPKPTRPLHSMMRRLVYLPILVSVLVLLGVLVLSTRLVLDEISRHQTQTITALAEYSDQYLKETSQALDVLALNLLSLPPNKHVAILHNTRTLYPRLTSIYFLDNQGIVRLEDARSASLIGLDLSNEPYFYDTRQARKVTFSSPFTSLDTNRLAIIIAAPAYQNGQFVGVLIGELDLADLRQAIERLQLEESETAYIVDQTGVLIAHPNQELVETRSNLRNIPLVRSRTDLPPAASERSPVTRSLYYDPYQEKWVIGSATRIAQDWLAVSTRAVNDVLWPLLLLLLAALTAIAMGFVLFAWQQRYLNERVSGPIANLAEQADRLSQGEFAAQALEDLLSEDLAARPAAEAGASGDKPADLAIDPPKAAVEFTEMGILVQSFNRLIRAALRRNTQLQQANQSLEVELGERRKAEETVRCLNAELEERVEDRTRQLQQTNRELEAFVYSISHDLRAPLRAINGFSRILQEDYTAHLDDEGRKLLERVLDATQRMQDLIEHLLRLSRLSQSQLYLSELDLSALVEELVQQILLERKVEPGVFNLVDFSCPPNLHCYADGHLLQVALDNLLRNAWKFSARQPQPRVEFGACITADGEPAYYVRDNGAGFDVSQARRLFEPFQRLHTQQEFPGTGIGLATVQRIIHRHGGRIWAEAEPGAGATFYFTLPQRKTPGAIVVE